jgi:hypothetical protein
LLLHSSLRRYVADPSEEITMKMPMFAACAAALTLTSVRPAHAESTETVTRSGPNRALLQSGVVALGVPYAASAVVAITSDHPGDKNLYLPVVGPWFDLGNRGSCGGALEPSCDRETAYKALLVADGIVQGIGALEIIGAFIYPEARTTRAATERTWAITPARLAVGSYGLAAFGRF